MKNANKPAMPLKETILIRTTNGATPDQGSSVNYKGLTKLELIAAMAMQGLLANLGNNINYTRGEVAEIATKHAGALLYELEELGG